MRTWDLRENPRNLVCILKKYSFKLAEEEREDVEKKVGESLDENLGFARKSAKFRLYLKENVRLQRRSKRM